MGWLKRVDFGFEIIDLMALRQDGLMQEAAELQKELEDNGCPNYLMEAALAVNPLIEKDARR